MVGRVATALRVASLACLISAPAALAADRPLPASVERALDRAIDGGDPEAIGQLVGGNPMIGVEIVVIAVTKRPDLAARIAAAAAGNAPEIAPQLAGAAAVASPTSAAQIATAVSVVVPAARPAVADAVVGTLPPDDRMTAGMRVHSTIGAVRMPSLEDPR